MALRSLPVEFLLHKRLSEIKMVTKKSLFSLTSESVREYINKEENQKILKEYNEAVERMYATGVFTVVE